MMGRVAVTLLLHMIFAEHVRADVAPTRNFPWGYVRIVDAEGEWWNETQATLFGGLVAGSLGILGAAYGIMAARGIALRFMLKATLLVGCVSGAVLVVGLIAAVAGQPAHVCFPQLLIGGVLSVLCTANYPIIKRRYKQSESEKISPQDS